MRPSRRRLPRGLRWHLTAWVAGVMVAAAAAVFVVVYRSTGSQLRGQVVRGVVAQTTSLEQALRQIRVSSARAVATAARRYVQAQPYTATSSLLFVPIPGAVPESNHPEVLRAGPPEPGESVADQAHENAQTGRLRVPRLGFSTLSVPDVGRMQLLERALSVGGLRVVAGAGAPLAVVESAQHSVARAFIVAGLIVLALALVASYVAGARVSAPLRRMAAVAARVDAGELAPRMEAGRGRADELAVLAESFNHMLDRLSDAISTQRQFVADASHELRTPLTVIRGQLEVLAAQKDAPAEEVRRVERLVGEEIARVGRLIDDLLALAQAERIDFLRPEPIELRSFVTELWDGISLTVPRRFELGPVPEGILMADPDRLAQALRNLARNAIEHTEAETGLVRLEVDNGGSGRVRFSVLDDGPGIPASERERIFERFHRVDGGRSRASGGAGLGLAIVRAIAEAHGGQATAGAAGDEVGAAVELILPGFRPR
jgi:two-component system OmpR family sensor kinase